MNRRTSLVALVSLVVIAACAVIVATRSDPSKIGGLGPIKTADDLPVIAASVPGPGAAEGWLNSKPLTAADLKGNVVVYDFWTYSCVNCVRTIPYVRAWYDRYKDEGLVIVGVHSPEFDFEHDHDNVTRAVKELDVTWPVALDDNMAIWSQFNNQYWPAKYITDRQGRLRYTHYGEGGYDETEDVLRALLDVGAAFPRASDETAPPEQTAAQVTPETYLGTGRGQTASPEGLHAGTASYTAPTSLPDDATALTGAWTVSTEYVEDASAASSIVLRYRGGEVNLVMEASDGKPVDVAIELDGHPWAARRSVTVSAADLYRLIAGGPTGYHTLRLTPARAGLRAYAFTFGS